ncbi:ABC transporter substrate-binding protein [Metabacillus arenae]|uniref:Carbohydrate ABC transporter substrate-binding protein n=1 Tax=Metabacillus arenae TaxID=2771434 RepID=A0A926NDD8_9BACI|nr:ABC transporter substrate-binding protein [Metabacillus arenae]MBD1379464.1 carbohydrate ABC transporter substrate-binding protein [Metabacillus arenae]
MLKRSLLFMLIGLMTLLLIACNKNSATSGEAEETVVIGDEEDATELTFWTFVELHTDLFKDSVERWNKEFPDKKIKLVAETYPYDNMHNNLLLALQSGKGAPDIADIEISRFPNYLQGEPQLEPMNDYVEPVKDKFVESRFDIYAKDENYYGIPTHVGATVMYYNTEIMEEAGVDIDSIKTWDDYVEAGKKVVENTDAVMTTVETEGFNTYWAMISQQDSDFFDKNGEVIIENETNVKTLQFLNAMVHKDKIAEMTPGGESHAEEYYKFMNEGGAASIAMPMWYMGRFTDYMEDLKGKITIRPLPAWEEGGKRSAGMGGTGTVITNQSEHAELAKEFLAYTKLSEKGNIALWKVLGFDPPRWDVWEHKAMKEDNKFYQYFGTNIFDVLLEIKDEINAVNVTAKTPLVQQKFNTTVFNNVIRQQSQTPEEALKQTAEEVRNN